MKKTLISSIIATMLLSATLPHFAYAKNGNQNNDLEVNNEEVQTIENFAQVKNEVVADNFKEEIFVDQETDEDILISIDDEVHATVVPVPLVIVLATIARYGITRAIAKHGVSRVTQATTSNAAKTKLATDTAARELAAELGYTPTNYISMGAKVFQRSAKDAVSGPQYIVRDLTNHVGGVWKGANSVSGLGSKSTRSGTYDAVLERIAD